MRGLHAHVMISAMNTTRTARYGRKGRAELRYEPVPQPLSLMVVGKPDADLPIIWL